MTKKFAVLILFCVAACAQMAGPTSITSNQCARIAIDGMGSVYLQVTGTWTGTLQPQVSIKGQAAANTQVTPSTSSSPQSTITASGAYYARVAGYNLFFVCGNTVASGTAKVYLNASPASH